VTFSGLSFAATDNPLSDNDLQLLLRFVERSAGAGFKLAVLEINSTAQFTAILKWLKDALPSETFFVREVPLHEYPGENIWAELCAIPSPDPLRREVWALSGLEQKANAYDETKPNIVQQLNVQRDLFVRDFPFTWLLFVYPAMARVLRKIAPDFCDYVTIWLHAKPLNREAPPPVEQGTRPFSMLGEALLPETLRPAYRAIELYQIDEARDLAAAARLTSPSADPATRAAFALLDGLIAASAGDAKIARARLEGAVQQARQLNEPGLTALTTYHYAGLQNVTGNIDAALDLLQESGRIFAQLELPREQAACRGQIADILAERGELDEALHLFEDELKVYEALGDERSQAATLGEIARIRGIKGEENEALRLLEEELKVHEAEGDKRSWARTSGDIARIRMARGELDAAARLLEEELKVYEALGDRHSRAATLGEIARIRVEKGDTDEALRLFEEALKFFEDFGDRRSRATMLGDIAHIRFERGDLERALRLTEDALKVFEGLGDLRSRAITLGQIANIREARGEVNEALRLHEESLQVYESLGYLEGRANALRSIGEIELQRRDFDGAMKHLFEAYDILLKIRRLDDTVLTGVQFGVMLLRSGDTEKGRAVLQRSREVLRTLGKLELAEYIEELIDRLEKTIQPTPES
jgi:tetratricopeptide (TPR) repeat protein